MQETQRIEALRQLDILDTKAEQAFDDLAHLAARALGLPAVAITLVDVDRVWVKSRAGQVPDAIGRSESFCQHTIAQSGVFQVEDARCDPRMKNSTIVACPDGVRFYAGAPVTLQNGATVGAICVLDSKAHEKLSAEQSLVLQSLASAVAHLLDLRREVATRRKLEEEINERARLLALAEQMARVGYWKLDWASNYVFMSPVVYEVFGVDPATFDPQLDSVLEFYVPADRDMVRRHVEQARATGQNYTFDARICRRSDGALRDVRATAHVEHDPDGTSKALIGVFQDVTDEKRAIAVLTQARHEAEGRSERMRQLATVDSLTGLLNRRAFIEAAEAALESRNNKPLTLAVVDVDHFKSINDRFGHAAGDDALRMLAKQATEALGGDALFGRIGGEEFAILLRSTSLFQAATILDKVREVVSATEVLTSSGQSFRLTVSAGLAEATENGTWSALFGRADRALYAAKAAGRNRYATAA